MVFIAYFPQHTIWKILQVYKKLELVFNCVESSNCQDWTDTVWRWSIQRGGRWDLAHSGPEPRALWYENDTAVPLGMTGPDWTGQHTEECLSAPIVSCLGKTFPIWESIKAFGSLWPPPFHTGFPLTPLFLSPPCVWCVNTQSLRFGRLTRILGENTPNFSHMWHASLNAGTRLHHAASTHAAKSKTDKHGVSHMCAETHTAYKPTYHRLSARMKHKASAPVL